MKILNKKAFAVIEYILLIVIIISAFLIMRSYIQRGIFGLWTQSGKSFAFGRQYDPQKTIECGFDGQSGVWYDHNCVEANCPGGDPACREGVISAGTCSSSSCAQLN